MPPRRWQDPLRSGDRSQGGGSGRQGVDVADRQAGGEEAEHQKGLRAGLVLDVVLDGVRDEVLDLEEYLHTAGDASG